MSGVKFAISILIVNLFSDAFYSVFLQKYKIKFYSYYYRNLFLKNIPVKKKILKEDDTPAVTSRLRHRNSVATSTSATLVSEHSTHSESVDEDEKSNDSEAVDEVISSVILLFDFSRRTNSNFFLLQKSS